MPKRSLRYFSQEISFPPREKPAWAISVARWHQLDAASFGLVQAHHAWKDSLKTPSFIILASPLASNEADHEFIESGAKSPSKMIHTLPSTRASPLCQAMNWSGPLLCLQKDPCTQLAGISEAADLVCADCPVVWVVGIEKISQGNYGASLVEVGLAEKDIFYTIPVSLLQKALPHRHPMLWIDQVLWATEGEGECRVSLQKEAHYFDKEGVRVSSLVEWMAQGYGFVRACQILMPKRNQLVQRPAKTYLAAISDIDFDPNMSDLLKTSDEIFIHVRTIRELGSLILIQAEIKGSQTTVLARGQLKVYGE